MKIFDAHISGSLSVSSSAHIEGDLTVLGTLFATVSGTTTNALTASEAPRYTLTSSFHTFTSSYTTGSFTGSFIGDGGNLYNIPASGVTGLNLNKITSGSVSASISPDRGLEVNTDLNVVGIITAKEIHTSIVTSSVLFESGSTIFGNTSDDTHQITGSVGVTGSLTLNNDPVVVNTTFNSFTSSADGRLSSIEGVTGSIALLNTYTGSNNTVIGTLQTSTSSLNSFTSSINTTIKNRLNDEGVISSSIQVTLSSTTEYTSFSSSIATTTSNIETRIGSLETSTGSLNTFSSSTLTRLTSIETATSSLNSYTSSNTSNINAIHTSTASLNSFTSSAGGRLNSIEGISGSIATLNTYTGSNNTVIGTLQTATSSLNSYTSSNTTNINAIHTATSSLNSYTSSNTTNINAIHTATSSLNSYTSSNNTNVNAIHTATSSLNSFTSSIDTTIKNKLNTEGVISGSVQVNITSTTGYSTFSSSIATTDLNQENRLSSLEGKTGSYATTGSNSFNGSQTITGSLIVSQNLTVLGSSSIVYSTASQLIVEDNVIVVNASYPAQRFSGLEVHDSGSNGNVTASLLWDGLNNRWIYQNSSDSHYGGAMFIAGPRNTGSLGDEQTLTNGRIPKSIGGDHIGDSVISELSGSIGISGSLSITGSIVSTTTALVSGSSQISFNGITDKPTLVSGSSQITFLSISSIPSGLVSGSSQVLNGSGVWSGSAQLPSGVVSGSSQVLAGTTIHSGAFFNGISVVSGSGQISFNGITDKPTLVSGSSQITFGSISGVPSGLVSGSSQVLNGSGVWSGSAQLPSGVVSGSSQITYGSISGIPSGIVSGSSQISFGSISGVPSGLVSGSSQVSIASTSGFGTYINQAVLTSSTPTFAGVKGSSYFDAKENSGFRIRNSADSANTGGFTRRGLWEGNSNYDVGIWAETGYGVYLYTNGSATARITVDTSGNTNVNGYLGVGQSPNTSYRIITAGDIYLNGNANGWAEGTWKQRRGGGTFYDVLDTNSYSSYALPLAGGTVTGEIITSYTNGINTVNGGSGYAIYRAYGNSNGVEVQLGAHQTSGYGTVGTYSASNFGIKTSNVLRAYWDTSGHLLPNSNGTYNLGSSSLRWNTVFTSDLSMSNGIGDYTIVEGEEDLFIYNNKTNKVFKFLLQEVDPSIAPPKKI